MAKRETAASQPDPWKKALAAAADPERAAHALERMRGAAGPAVDAADAPTAQALSALFSGSQALSAALVANPNWLEDLRPDVLQFARRKQGLAKEIEAWLPELLRAQDYSAALRRLRKFKQRQMFRIAVRDLARLSDVTEITLELSNLADVCLHGVWLACLAQLIHRHGQPCHQTPAGRWLPTPACVLGMGKLGGQELNYSSDVDVLFVYAEEGSVFRTLPTRSARPRPVLANHVFFNKLAESFIAEVSRMAPEGALYRIDLRLRPEGDAGPLSRSLAGYENYYAQWGQTWERMMLIKARGVAGDASLAAEFLETVQPFRYPRSINQNVLNEVAAMKDRIEHEVVKAGELERNVKLGRGGIREIEFVAQALQLLHAGRQPFLQGAQTLPTLEKLVQYELLAGYDSARLREAYVFLRDVEHRLQMEDNLQTHTLPTESRALERLARLMGFASRSAFDTVHRHLRAAVRSIFEKLLRADDSASPAASPIPAEFEGREAEWKSLLARHRFREPDQAFRVLREFVEGPGYVHVSPRTIDLARQLVARLLALCPGVEGAKAAVSHAASAGRLEAGHVPLSDPDRVATRLDSYINAYGARGTLFELWNSNPRIFDLLVLLFDRSEFLAELAIRTPDLVDELVTSDRLRQRKSAQETLTDLRHGLGDEDQHQWLRRYHQAELMRIGLRDILGLADFEQYLVELSALADACLRYALEAAMRKHKFKAPPFAIIGLGKLGGSEIDYGSDLDVIFVADPGVKDLARLGRVAVDILDLLSRRTELGLVFNTDARLRPDGEKGLMVATLKGVEEYYRQRAQLWEIQTLTRTRFIAGDEQVGRAFQALAGRLANFKTPDLPLVAFTPDWKARIHSMRLRIEKERTPAGKEDLAIKTGLGGLIDAEFVAQALCMEQGWQEANTLAALERGRSLGCLRGLPHLIDHYRRLRRVEGILRRWSYEGETVLPDDPAPYYRVSVRCGFESPEAFRHALGEWRAAIRRGYLEVFG